MVSLCSKHNIYCLEKIMEVIKMTKAELVDFIAEKADLTKADAGRALEAMMEGVTNGLKETGKVTLVGFGTFTAKKEKLELEETLKLEKQ